MQLTSDVQLAFGPMHTACTHPLHAVLVSHQMPCFAPLAGYLLGKAGVPKHAIITALGGTPTPNLAAFIDALKVAAREAERLPGGV